MARGTTTDLHMDRLAQAQAAVDAMKDGYKGQLQNDVGELSTMWSSIDAKTPDAGLMDQVFGLAHNLKGQAGSFGYDLVTSVAASLCELLSDDRINPAKIKAAAQHVSVLGKIVEKDIVGDGGDLGVKIQKALKDLYKEE